MPFAGSTTDPKSAYSYPLATEVMVVVEKERKDPKTLNVEQQKSLISPSVKMLITTELIGSNLISSIATEIQLYLRTAGI